MNLKLQEVLQYFYLLENLEISEQLPPTTLPKEKDKYRKDTPYTH